MGQGQLGLFYLSHLVLLQSDMYLTRGPVVVVLSKMLHIDLAGLSGYCSHVTAMVYFVFNLKIATCK